MLAAACEIRPADRVLDLTAPVARRLPFPDASFDSVTSAFGVIHAPDPKRAATELDRVVRPGGRIGIAAWAPSGAMGRALALAADRLGRPEARAAARWGRFEDAYRRFGFHPGFAVAEHSLELEVPDLSSAVALLLDAPGPLNAGGPARETLERELAPVLDAHARRAGSGVAIRLDYVVIGAAKAFTSL